MKAPRLLLLSILLGVSLSAWSQTSSAISERLKHLEDAVKKEVESAPSPAPSGSASEDYQHRPEAGRMYLAQLRNTLARGEPAQIEEMLNQISVYFTSDAVKNEAESLAAELRKEREAKEAAQIAELNTAIQHASDAVRGAKTPADLDAVLMELTKFREQRENSYGSPMLRAALNKAQSAQQFVTRWQDYLAGLDAGNIEAATNALQNISNTNETAALVPRSEVLAKIQALKNSDVPLRKSAGGERAISPAERLDEIMAKTKTLDDVDAALKALRKLQSETRSQSYTSNDPVVATASALNSIEKTYREYLAGFPTSLDTPQSGNSAESPAVIPLKTELLLLVLPRSLNLPANVKPNPGEAVQSFLERIADAAKDRGDAALLSRVRDAQRLLFRGQSVTDSVNAFHLLTAAQNQEAAGQWMLAVDSYQDALKNGGDAIPAKTVGERLAAIKEAHPKEFEQGMERFLNPPPVQYPPGYGSGNFPPNSPAAYRAWLMRNRTPEPGATEKPVLAIPGGSPAPSATPAATSSPSVPAAKPQ